MRLLLAIIVLMSAQWFAPDAITYDLQFWTPQNEPYQLAHNGERFYINLDIDTPPVLAADAYVDIVIDPRLDVELPGGNAICKPIDHDDDWHNLHCTALFGQYLSDIWIYATVPTHAWGMEQFSVYVSTPNESGTSWLAYQPPRTIFLPRIGVTR